MDATIQPTSKNLVSMYGGRWGCDDLSIDGIHAGSDKMVARFGSQLGLLWPFWLKLGILTRPVPNPLSRRGTTASLALVEVKLQCHNSGCDNSANE